MPLHEAKKRVLVIDRNADAAEILGLLLRAHGYDVRVERDGLSGLRVAKLHRPRAVILDLGIDTMDAYETAARLRAIPGLRDVYLISLSGCNTPAAYLAGDGRFNVSLTKPSGYRALIGELERYFRGDLDA